jgi:DNA-binding transcriptional LysR family regulator
MHDELLTDPRFFSLARREADLAFRIGAFNEPDVVSRKLMRIHYGAYVRKGPITPPPVTAPAARYWRSTPDSQVCPTTVG